MPFANGPLDPAELPRLDQLELRPVSRSYARYRVVHSMMLWIPVLVVLALMPAGGPIPPSLPVFGAPLMALLGPLYSTLCWLEARRRSYALRQHDLVYSSGLLVRRTRVLPLVRIQHVETISGPLERLFGLVRLNCFTAGGSSGDLLLAGLTADTAGRLREYLLSRIGHEEADEDRRSDG
jgi:uncharacterized protein